MEVNAEEARSYSTSRFLKKVSHFKLALVLGVILLFYQIPANKKATVFFQDSTMPSWEHAYDPIVKSLDVLGCLIAYVTVPLVFRCINLAGICMVCGLVAVSQVIFSFLPFIWTSVPLHILIGFSSTMIMVAISTRISREALTCSYLEKEKQKIFLYKNFAALYSLSEISLTVASILHLTLSYVYPEADRLETKNGTRVHEVSCLPLVNLPSPKNYTDWLFATTLKNWASWILTDFIEFGVLLVFCMSLGLVAAFQKDLLNRVKLNEWTNLLSSIETLADTRFLLLVPSFISAGLLEGFLFSDYIRSNLFRGHYNQYLYSALVYCGIFSTATLLLVGFLAKYIKKIYMMITTSLVHILVVIWHLVWPINLIHPSGFLILCILIGISKALWKFQISVSAGLKDRPQCLQLYNNMVLFYKAGQFLACVTSSYLCVNTRLYILLISAIISQFTYFIKELTDRIEKISKMSGRKPLVYKSIGKGLHNSTSQSSQSTCHEAGAESQNLVTTLETGNTYQQESKL